MFSCPLCATFHASYVNWSRHLFFQHRHDEKFPRIYQAAMAAKQSVRAQHATCIWSREEPAPPASAYQTCRSEPKLDIRNYADLGYADCVGYCPEYLKSDCLRLFYNHEQWRSHGKTCSLCRDAQEPRPLSEARGRLQSLGDAEWAALLAAVRRFRLARLAHAR